MSLQYMSTELLTKIFEYCDITELHNLQQSCKRFYEIIRAATNLGNVQPFLVTNQLSQSIKKRSLKLLTLKEKFCKLKNWENGLYKEFYLLKERKKFMPKIVLTNDTLWISKGNKVFGHKRNKVGISLDQRDVCTVKIPCTSDISSFLFKENCIITGQHNGSIFVKNLKEQFVFIKDAHDCDVHGIDASHGIFVSGDRSGCLKIWNLDSCQLEYGWHDVDDRIWSVALSKPCEYLAVGTANMNSVPLYIYDINSCKRLHELGKNLPNNAGLLQLKWESPCVLLSCGYDGSVHKWDLRCNLCVQEWKDIFLTPVYCFDTDDYCTLITGMAMHGRAVLWDMRMKTYIQMYFMESCKEPRYSSPIYSLAFDVDHLFAATDYYLNVLYFSVKTGIAKNYNITALPYLAY